MTVLYSYFPSEQKAHKAMSVLRDKGFKTALEMMGKKPVEGIDHMNNPYSGELPAYLRAIGTDIAVAGITDSEGLFAPPAYLGSAPPGYLEGNPYRVAVEGEPYQLEEALRIIKTYDGRI